MSEYLGQQQVIVLVFLLGAMTLDTLVRRIAFDRLESIAIGVAIFSFLYDAFELLKGFLTDNEDINLWIKAFLGLVLVIVLVVIHRELKEKVKKKIEGAFAKLLAQNEGNKSELLNTVRLITLDYIEVGLWQEKEIKKTQRERILQVLNTAGLNEGKIVKEEDFELGDKIKKLASVCFFVGAIFSVIIPMFQ